MVSHHPAKFGDHRHCGSRDKMILVAEGFYMLLLKPPLLFISKAYSIKANDM